MAQLNSILALLCLSMACHAQAIFPGPIMRTISGSGSFSPSDISGMIAWWAADSISSSDGTEQNSWSDLSGNGYTLTSFSGKGPTWESNEQNGKPAMLFNGTTQYMTNNSFGTALSGTDKAMTCFLVMKSVVGTGFIMLFSGGSSTDADPLIAPITDSRKPGWAVRDDGGTVLVPTATGALDGTNYKVLSFQTTGTAATIWVNAVVTSVSGGSANVGTITCNRGTVGAYDRNGALANFANIWLAELIIYDSALSTTDRQNVETWLNTKYAVF